MIAFNFQYFLKLTFCTLRQGWVRIFSNRLNILTQKFLANVSNIHRNNCRSSSVVVSSSLQSQMAASIHADDVQHDCISRLRHTLGKGSSSTSQIVTILSKYQIRFYHLITKFCSFDTDADPHNAVSPLGIMRESRA